MKVYKITENAYIECGKILTLLSDLEEYIPEVQNTVSRNPTRGRNYFLTMIDFIDEFGDSELYPKDSAPYRDGVNKGNRPSEPLTLEYLEQHDFPEEVLNDLITEDFLEIDWQINSYMEQVEFNVKEEGQNIFLALITAVDDFETSYTNIAEELENTPNGLTTQQVDDILSIVTNRQAMIRLQSLPREYFKIMNTKSRPRQHTKY